MELVRKKEFVPISHDLKDKAFIIHIIFLVNSNIYPFYRVQIALLKANKALITIFPEYSNFANNFSPQLVTKLLEYAEINNHAIDLISDK